MEQKNSILEKLKPRTEDDLLLEEAKIAWNELWLDEEESSLIKYVPIINAVLLFIILIMLFLKK